MRTSLRLLVPLMLASAVLGLVGCASSATASNSIVTTTTQTADFTRELTAGTEIEVVSLIEPGMEVHGFEPTAADLERMRKAAVIVENGAGLEESWLPAAVQASGFGGTLVDASTQVTLGGSDDEHDHEDGDDHSSDDHDHADDASTGAHSHEGNPHIWTSPANASAMVTEIATQLRASFPEQAATIEANAAAYLDRLSALDSWVSANVSTVAPEQRTLVTTHDGLYYFNQAYGIEFIGAVIPSWDDSAEPSVAELDALAKLIQEHQVRAIFTETQLDPATTERLGQVTGATVFSGDDALTVDSLGAEGTETGTYIGATVRNTQLLMESWGATAQKFDE